MSREDKRTLDGISPQEVMGVTYAATGDVVADACKIVDSAQQAAYRSVNTMLVVRNWLLGRRIAEEELRGEGRVEYGAEVVKRLASRLTEEFGKGFSRSALWRYEQFYRMFPEIVATLSRQSSCLGVSRSNSTIPHRLRRSHEMFPGFPLGEWKIPHAAFVDALPHPAAG